MKFKTKETILSDGSKVHDVDIFPNGNEMITGQPMCIFSCISERHMISFVNGLTRLIEQHTVETFDETPYEELSYGAPMPEDGPAYIED